MAPSDSGRGSAIASQPPVIPSAILRIGDMSMMFARLSHSGNTPDRPPTTRSASGASSFSAEALGCELL